MDHVPGRYLILTIAVGFEYQALASLTHPSIQAYASRIGADFKVITTSALSSPHWEKFVIAEMLNTYDRVLYLDTDLIIRDDCPNLFELVPNDCLGAFNEAPFTARPKELMIDCCHAYGVTLPFWDGTYYNTGVLVASQCHQSLFVKPAHEECNFYEQTYFNMNIALRSVKIFALPYKYNRMSCLDAPTGEHRIASHIIHYAGAPNIQTLFPTIRQDLESWRRCEGHYDFVRHVHILVSGGLGDQVQAEPVIRYMQKHIYPSPATHITVSTGFPELFRHLGVAVYAHGDFVPEPDTPYFTIQSFPPPESINYRVLCNLLCHTTDYISAALLRRILPIADKRIRLAPTSDDLASLRIQAREEDLNTLVLVHAGRHWESKTFPLSWWQAVVDVLSAAGMRVCLIGQNDETRGVLPLACPVNGLDLRDCLSLCELIALLKQAPVLVSNDSAPIHLAGAFDNAIVLIPSCKNPEHVLPYRHGNVFWNATALYKRLTIDDANCQPTAPHGSSAEFIVRGWDDYLPNVEEVIDVVAQYMFGIETPVTHADR